MNGYAQRREEAVCLLEMRSRHIVVRSRESELRQGPMRLPDHEPRADRGERSQGCRQLPFSLPRLCRRQLGSPQDELSPAGSVPVPRLNGDTEPLADKLQRPIELAAREIGFTEKRREPALQAAESEAGHLRKRLLQQCNRLGDVTLDQVSVAEVAEGDRRVDRVWRQVQPALTLLDRGFPLTLERVDPSDR